MSAFLSRTIKNLQLIPFGVLVLPLLLGLLPADSRAQNKSEQQFSWQKVSEGYSFGRYRLNPQNELLSAEVLLLKFSLEQFSLSLSYGNEKGTLLDAKRVGASEKAVAAINAHFFDTKHHPLGVLIQNGKKLTKVHRGGRLLTGVFYLKSGEPHIKSRNTFSSEDVSLAIQAGPRMISQGRKIPFTDGSKSSRRSGIAVTRSKEVILYATPLRFPGASFTQIQSMLSDPVLEVSDALNFDGGSSSQLFIRKNDVLSDDLFVTGGQRVPVVLVVKKRNQN